MGSLGVVTMATQKPALELTSTASFARVVVLLVLLCVLFHRSSFLATQTSPAAPPPTAGFPSSMVKAAGPLAAPATAICVT